MGGISQLKTLQQFDTSVQLNKNIAGFANFTFRIENAIFIESVLLDILIRSITFYIVPINTRFLLCLAEIDKLKAYFNNIIN